MRKQLFLLSTFVIIALSSCTTNNPRKKRSSSVESQISSISATTNETSAISNISNTSDSSTTKPFTNSSSIIPTPKILSNIEVSNFKASFELNDEFIFGGIVTAIYSDSTREDVTTKAKFLGFDSTTLGTKQITVSYTYELVTKNCHYDIVVSEKQTDLGKQKISYILNYINEHQIALNQSKIGVDQTTHVSFDGLALEKFDLFKTTKSFGLDISYRYKVLLGDETGIIVCASNSASGSLYDKVSDYAGKNTSKYTISGYLSVYLGHPEIVVEKCTYNPDLNVTCNPKALAKDIISLSSFYNIAKTNFYNCAGHGYGDLYTVTSVTCFKYESDGQHQKFYYFTDGTQYLKTIAQNISASISEGKTYNITGTISIQNYGAAMRILSAESTNETALNALNYNYRTMSLSNLRKTLNAPQDDTLTRYEDLTLNKSYFYKYNGFLTAVEKSGTLYISFGDEYYGENFLSNTIISDSAEHYNKYAISMITNDNFWNITDDEASKFNPFYNDYVCENVNLELGYLAENFEFRSGRIFWKITLLPNYIPA